MTLRHLLARLVDDHARLPAFIRGRGFVAPAIVGLGAVIALTNGWSGEASASPAPAPMPKIDSKPLPLIAKPRVYVAPIRGQVCTDVHADTYKELVQDVRKAKPDIIVFHMDCHDIPKSLLFDPDPDEIRRESGIPDFDHIRLVARAMREELLDVPQVLWIEDAVGVSSVLALAWPDIYMSSKARFGGFDGFVPMIKRNYSQEDVQAKMVAASVGGVQGLLAMGGYPETIGLALLYPEQVLSANFEGREVRFANDVKGQWLIDGNPARGIFIRSTTAEDVGLSDGTADSFEDLMFILGYREFEKLDSGEKLVTEYIEAWRKAMDKCIEMYRDAREKAGGNVKDLAQAKSLLEKVLALIERYPALETRLGLTAIRLRVEIDQIQEVIIATKKAEREGGRSTGGGNRSGRKGGMSAPGG